MFQRLSRAASDFLRDDRGQDLIEYGLLACLIATVAIVAMTQVGEVIRDTFWDVIAAAVAEV
jgi:Flp pilus assembly pilin Flp